MMLLNPYKLASLGSPITNNFLVRGFSDSNYLAGANGEGPLNMLTMRAIVKLLSVPSGQKVLIGRLDGGGQGYSLRANGAGAGLEAWQFSASTSAIPLTSADVGKWFCLHQVFNSAAGKLRIYLNGLLWDEVSASNSSSAGTGLWVGRFQHAGGLAASDFAFADIAFSSAVLTPGQIASDAETIVAANIIANDLPSQTFRFNADDLVSSSNWVSRTGSLTLVRNGSLTVEAIS